MKLKSTLLKILSFTILLLASESLSAQANGPASKLLMYALIAVGILLFIAAILTVSDNLLQIEAQKAGADTTKKNYSIFPGVSELVSGSNPAHIGDHKVHKLKKGYDIKLVGEAVGEISPAVMPKTFAIKPTNFRELSPIPKVQVNAGDEVLAGDVLFVDKKDDRVKYVAPVSGEIAEIRRGEKRAISDVIILADKEIKYKKHHIPNLEEVSRTDLVNYILNSGAWALINQRPYDIVANPDITPENIFISTFDSAPLAGNLTLGLTDKSKSIQAAISVLAKLTSGQVHLGIDAADTEARSGFWAAMENCKKHWFSGSHPIGNVGVQIHHIAPIGSTRKVWTIAAQDLVTIGDLFTQGIYNAERTIAVTGSGVSSPGYIKTYIGANVGDLVKSNLTGDNQRIIAGNVLTGEKVGNDHFLNQKDTQITVIPEGDKYEMFGWLLPLTPRPSVSKTFPNFMMKDHKFDANTNTHGEKRAFVMTGQYEKVLPMDIHVQQLMKSILANDYERMEGLGITELSEEDVALCEFVCTSKMPLQKILREGLDMMREQG